MKATFVVSGAIIVVLVLLGFIVVVPLSTDMDHFDSGSPSLFDNAFRSLNIVTVGIIVIAAIVILALVTTGFSPNVESNVEEEAIEYFDDNFDKTVDVGTMYCKYCDTKYDPNNPSEKFCENCGASLKPEVRHRGVTR